MSRPPYRSSLADNEGLALRQAALAELSLGQRIKEKLGDRDFAWLSRETGISTSALSDVNTKGKIPRADNAFKIAQALGVDVEWLLTGHASSRAHLQSDIRRAMRQSAETDNHAAAVELLDLVSVQEIDLAYGLGGQFSDGPVEVQTHHFPRDWVQSITSAPASMLTIARGRGDSMQPTIQDGDMVIIDRSQRTIREQDAMWALTIGDFAMIKRVRSRGERIQILSDNTLVPMDEAHHEEINVVGRVIFVGRRV